MSNLRNGSKGTYYGSFMGESNPLSTEQMTVNAIYINSYLKEKGWSINSISALLGNMQAESTMNPGRWQSESVGNLSMGYGLVQWTPSTKYTEWAISNGFNDYSEMDANLSRIIYEVENNIQWIKTDAYDMRFIDFTLGYDGLDRPYTLKTLTEAFLINYERPADQSDSVKAYRVSLAENWYKVISGGAEPDIPSSPTIKRKSKFKFLLLNANRRRNAWIRKGL